MQALFRPVFGAELRDLGSMAFFLEVTAVDDCGAPMTRAAASERVGYKNKRRPEYRPPLHN
jgi:hypothetical protein